MPGGWHATRVTAERIRAPGSQRVARAGLAPGTGGASAGHGRGLAPGTGGG